VIDGVAYLADAKREFQRLRSLAERAAEQIDDRAFFDPIDEDANSVAIIMKHIAGNLRSRWTEFLTTDGEKPTRRRDEEFVVFEDETRDGIMASWSDGWAILFDALDSVDPERLDASVTIRGEPHKVIQAIGRQLTHYAYHVGQIVFLARHFAGTSWESLSIPRGGSEAFNRAPRRYKGGDDVR